MGVFISVPKTIECIVIAAVFAVMLCIAAYRQLGVLQSSGYSNVKYTKWLKKKGNLAFERFILLAMLCALSSAVASLCFSFTGEWAAVISLAFCFSRFMSLPIPKSHCVPKPSLLRECIVFIRCCFL